MNTEASEYLHPCPCCGSSTISQPGTYEVCDVCHWEDDPVQSDDPTFAGGANAESLVTARRIWESNFLPGGPHEGQEFDG